MNGDSNLPPGIVAYRFLDVVGLFYAIWQMVEGKWHLAIGVLIAAGIIEAAYRAYRWAPSFFAGQSARLPATSQTLAAPQPSSPADVRAEAAQPVPRPPLSKTLTHEQFMGALATAAMNLPPNAPAQLPIPPDKIDPTTHVESMPDRRQKKKITCPLCKGSGRQWDRYEKPCQMCKGRSTIETYRVGQPACRPCKGTGWNYGRYENPCEVCGGVGLMPYEFQDKDHLINK